MTEVFYLPAGNGKPTLTLLRPMELRIVHYNNPVLRAKGEKVNAFDAALAEFANDMIDTMHEAGGIGLAAQQVGKAIQLCVVDLREWEKARLEAQRQVEKRHAELRASPGVNLLHKPYRRETLASKIRAALGPAVVPNGIRADA